MSTGNLHVTNKVTQWISVVMFCKLQLQVDGYMKKVLVEFWIIFLGELCLRQILGLNFFWQSKTQVFQELFLETPKR